MYLISLKNLALTIEVLVDVLVTVVVAVVILVMCLYTVLILDNNLFARSAEINDPTTVGLDAVNPYPFSPNPLMSAAILCIALKLAEYITVPVFLGNVEFIAVMSPLPIGVPKPVTASHPAVAIYPSPDIPVALLPDVIS